MAVSGNSGLEEWIDEARALAAQCWCDEETKHKCFDPVLAEAVAIRMAELMKKAAYHQYDAQYWFGRAVNCVQFPVRVEPDGSVYVVHREKE